MIDVGDILDVIRQRFAANASAVAGITGGLHDGRAVGDTTGIYGVVDVAPRDPQRTGTDLYIQTFEVRIRLYTGAAISSQTAINLLDTALQLKTRTTYSTTTGTTPVLHILKSAGNWKLEQQRNEGEDVREVTCSYEVMIEGS